MTCLLPKPRHSAPTHRVVAIAIFSVSAVHCFVFLFAITLLSVFCMNYAGKNGGFTVGVNNVMSFVLERLFSLVHVG